MRRLLVKSAAFGNNERIPVKYTCDGADVNPPVTIDGVPEEAKTLVLIVDDPDAMGTFTHWVVWNIPATTRRIEENTTPGKEGISSYGKHSYGGPRPPTGTHRYFFKVYALDTELDLKLSSTKRDVAKAMEGHVLAEGELLGLYSRQ